MLKSHRNLLDSRPSDRVRIGDRVVDIPLREIAPADGSAEPVRVTLKSIAVLLTLIAHAGKLVSREALLEWVWPDTLPTDDVLTQAVTQLRKAFGDDRENPRYIDTIAKQGYRLIASVRWLVEDDVAHATDDTVSANEATAETVTETNIDASRDAMPAEAAVTPSSGVAASDDAAVSLPTSPPTSPPTSRRRSTVVAATVAVSIAAAATVSLALWSKREQATPNADASAPRSGARNAERAKALLPPFQLIAFKPQGEYRPSLSPDGALLAYVEEGPNSITSSLWVQTTAPLQPQRLTEPVEKQWDLMPSWSPDGRQIAFIRENEARCSVMLIPAAGGSAREAGECLGGVNHRIAWYPDGKALVAAQMPSYYTSLSHPKTVEKALYRMSLDTGRWERIPYERSPSDEDMMPAVSPDGRWIAFQRNLSLGDLWRIPVTGGKPERLTQLRGNFYGVAWLPDSRGLVFSRYREGKASLGALDIASGRVVDFEDRGRNGLAYPNIARNGSALGFEVESSHISMRKIDLRDASEQAPADPMRSALMRGPRLLESTGSNEMPSIAPDGRQLIFASDRSAEMRLWWLDQSQPESLRFFENFVPITRYPVLWDADSKHALAIGEGPQGMGAYEIDPQRGRLAKLPIPDRDPVHAAYHPNPQRFLAVVDRGEGRLAAKLYDRSVQPWRILAQVDDVSVALVDAPNRRILLARMSSSEIWQTDLDLNHPRKIDRTTVQRRNRTLNVSPDGAWVMDSGPGCEWRWRPVAIADAPASKPKALCLGIADWGAVGVSYHAGQRAIYLATLEDVGSDIALMPLKALNAALPPPKP